MSPVCVFKDQSDGSSKRDTWGWEMEALHKCVMGLLGKTDNSVCVRERERG